MFRPSAIPKMMSMLGSVLRGVRLPDLEKIKTITRQSFPTVRQISTLQLAEWMNNAKPDLLLVDVRGSEEFAVSQLHGAINATTAEGITEVIRERKPATAVLYCSVGFRSSRLAEQLARQGINNVANLEGSIFQWANEGRPLYQGQTPVQQVHPYGKRWAGLLRPGLART
ncbi:MAG TPA: rhodanese-like domain-containing protein [Verrucomicrobiae bacterium]|nr:rhodanese-like domain-containing protein [Verrucomicrobiae bacterium]